MMFYTPALETKRLLALGCFTLGVPFAITLEWWLVGLPLWSVAAWLIWSTRDRSFQRRFGLLFACALLLAFVPINTNTSNENFLLLGLVFLAVILLPWLVLRRTDPKVIVYRLWPSHFSWLEFGYVVLSIPLAWGGFWLYFWLSPEVPFNWLLPAVPNDESLLRLFVGINLVGIWDEVFFINTSFAILRSLFPFTWANLAQMVLYSSVLVDMAFRGWGPVFVAVLAITQGFMFERSKVVAYVVAVHLIVDYFLFQAIVSAHYPGFKNWWHP
jgi:hypothetical protein